MFFTKRDRKTNRRIGWKISSTEKKEEGRTIILKKAKNIKKQKFYLAEIKKDLQVYFVTTNFDMKN